MSRKKKRVFNNFYIDAKIYGGDDEVIHKVRKQPLNKFIDFALFTFIQYDIKDFKNKLSKDYKKFLKSLK